MDSKDKPSATQRVSDWLVKEGYPLEFAASNAFRAAGFRTSQGAFARSKSFEAPREIDVCASISASAGRSLIRVYHIVECKWSQDKPWVIFTDAASLHPNAVVAQTIGSEVGQSALWVAAPRSDLHNLHCFLTRERTGFNGRQAFGGQPDQFYSTIQSTVEKTIAIAERYDDYEYEPSKVMMCVVAFPVVVISGLLFEARYNVEERRVELSEADHVRVVWNGADKWKLHASVDVIRESALPAFCEARAEDMKILVTTLQEVVGQFHECFKTKSLEPLRMENGARGVLGPPAVVRKIREHIEKPPQRRRRVRSRGVDI